MSHNISVVIPVYNEVDSLSRLHQEVSAGLPDSGEHEIIFIDDGSTDGSLGEMKALAKTDSRIRILSFFSNFGKAAALSAGFAEASGDVIITMDSDLQDDPGEIVSLVTKLDEGWDMVSGWKQKRHDPISKRWPSKIFNFVVRIMTGVKIHDFNCGLKAYRSEVVQSIDVYGGLHRYIPALASYKGFRVTEKVVQHRARIHGRTKYGLVRYFHGLLDLITVLFLGRYFQRPLHFFGLFGLLFALSGFGISLYLTINWFMGATLANRPLLFLGMLLMIVGIQFFSLGLIAEIFVQRRYRDQQMVKERIPS